MLKPPLERIEELFHHAVELNLRERNRFLGAECEGDEDLRTAVEALLRRDEELDAATDVIVSPVKRSLYALMQGGAREEGSEFLPRPSHLAPRPSPPGYEILEELGHGGMGVVYKARQLGLNRLVALKMLLSSASVGPEQLVRFRTEAETLGRLQHPHIVQIYEIGQQQGLPYYAMEYIDGPSLAQRLAGVPQNPREAARLVEILARAMAAVHQCGIIHRDLKPGNILLTSGGVVTGEWSISEALPAQGTDGTKDIRQHSAVARPLTPHHSPLTYPKITDFGLAKRLEGSGAATQTGSVMGTPDYMAPEQARGEIDALGPWTDIYALGAILYEMITGKPPFKSASPAETLARVVSEEPVSRSRRPANMPRDLATICFKCLEKDHRRRYSSALELAEDLRRFQAGEPIMARSVGLLGRTWRWCRRQPIAAASLFSASALGITLLVTVLVYNGRLQNALTREQFALENRVQVLHFDFNMPDRDRREADTLAASSRFASAKSGSPANEREDFFPVSAINNGPSRIIASHWSEHDCWLALENPNHDVQVWDLGTRAALGPVLQHQAAVYLAQFSPDGRSLATATVDGNVRIWKWDNGSSHQLPVRPGTVPTQLVFSKDGRFLLTRTQETAIRCWDTSTGNPVRLPTPMVKSSQA